MASFSNVSIDTVEDKHKEQPKGSFQKIIEEGMKDRKKNRDLDFVHHKPGLSKSKPKYRTQSKPQKHQPQRVSLKPKKTDRYSSRKKDDKLKHFLPTTLSKPMLSKGIVLAYSNFEFYNRSGSKVE